MRGRPPEATAATSDPRSRAGRSTSPSILKLPVCAMTPHSRALDARLAVDVQQHDPAPPHRFAASRYRARSGRLTTTVASATPACRRPWPDHRPSAGSQARAAGRGTSRRSRSTARACCATSGTSARTERGRTRATRAAGATPPARHPRSPGTRPASFESRNSVERVERALERRALVLEFLVRPGRCMSPGSPVGRATGAGSSIGRRARCGSRRIGLVSRAPGRVLQRLDPCPEAPRVQRVLRGSFSPAHEVVETVGRDSRTAGDHMSSERRPDVDDRRPQH